MRILLLDQIRGVAIILMILFHLNYYLVNIFQINVLNISGFFWFLVGKTAVITFIFVSGIAFYLARLKYKQKIYLKYIKNSIFLGLIAGLISILTYFFIPTEFIVFGIIHFFALSFLLILVFHKLGYINLIIGIGFLITGFFLPLEVNNEYLYFLGFIDKGFRSADFYPIFPYFGHILLGYVVGKYLSDCNKLNSLKFGIGNKILLFLSFIGKRSLLIYLLHPPLIIFFIWFLKKI